MVSSVDCALAGGGLANALIALALRRSHPDMRVVILERSAKLGGDKTWSFHDADFAIAEYPFLAPLVVRSWPRQEVRFPRYTRQLATGYHSISSQRLHEELTSVFGADVRLNQEVTSISSDSVTLASGERILAPCVIDGRGLSQRAAWRVGYQKFFGLEVELEEDCGLDHPIIMDATVEQIDGYRFVYTLPFEPRRILIEDTYYSNIPDLDGKALKGRIMAYAASKSWRIVRVLRQEAGALPIPHDGNFAALWPEEKSSAAAPSGVRALLFQPTTGYSLPDAARMAKRIAALDPLVTSAAAHLLRTESKMAWEHRWFFRLLNRLMFVAAEPHERLRIMQRFYTLPEPLIRRFYACDLTFADKARILTGKPPISFFRALGVVKERP
jgi:lycopene beta-cyclase